MTEMKEKINNIEMSNKLRKLLDSLQDKSENLAIYKSLKNMKPAEQATLVNTFTKDINQIKDQILKLFNEVRK